VLNRRLEIAELVESVCAASEAGPSQPLEVLQVDGHITTADSGWQTPWNTAIMAIIAQNVARVEFRDRNRQSPRIAPLDGGLPNACATARHPCYHHAVRNMHMSANIAGLCGAPNTCQNQHSTRTSVSRRRVRYVFRFGRFATHALTVSAQHLKLHGGCNRTVLPKTPASCDP
jgi:hypothetical protein